LVGRGIVCDRTRQAVEAWFGRWGRSVMRCARSRGVRHGANGPAVEVVGGVVSRGFVSRGSVASGRARRGLHLVWPGAKAATGRHRCDWIGTARPAHRHGQARAVWFGCALGMQRHGRDRSGRSVAFGSERSGSACSGSTWIGKVWIGWAVAARLTRQRSAEALTGWVVPVRSVWHAEASHGWAAHGLAG
jgi:hypothetical protein